MFPGVGPSSSLILMAHGFPCCSGVILDWGCIGTPSNPILLRDDVRAPDMLYLGLNEQPSGNEESLWVLSKKRPLYRRYVFC